jgi:general secretion pathway protein E/type IV pilus assembly protein PilB
MPKLTDINISTALVQLLSSEQAWHYHILPKFDSESHMAFYIDENQDMDSIQQELEMIFGKTIELEPVESQELHLSLGRYYRKSEGKKKSKQAKININSDEFLLRMIAEANEIGSSDIHIEAYEEIRRIRMRIDGKLVERYVIEPQDYPALVNKVKIKSNLDIAEKRLPQDGRIFYSDEDQKFDIRVSVLPTLHGEKVVMRLLSKDTSNLDINYLGFDDRQLSDYLEGIKKPHGIVLISGPTGSGKTTTLYATLKILNQEATNISTIEDPIEYTLDGINQTQLREGIGLTFASALRTFLRQDPDIIMLGEIRDSETAEMSIRASLTGHLVLSTIHTNSAWETISRLVDMGVAPYLLASTLNLSVAQRLVRVLCPECKQEQTYKEGLLPKKYIQPKKVDTYYKATGCEHCYYTGYKGRKAVYEIIPIDNDLVEKIKQKAFDVREILKEKEIKTLSDSAFELFEKGETSLEEVYPILLSAT